MREKIGKICFFCENLSDKFDKDRVLENFTVFEVHREIVSGVFFSGRIYFCSCIFWSFFPENFWYFPGRIDFFSSIFWKISCIFLDKYFSQVAIAVTQGLRPADSYLPDDAPDIAV